MVQPSPLTKLTSFYRDNPLISWLLSFCAAGVLSQLGQLFGGEDVTTTSREQTALVIVAGGVIVIGGLFATLAQVDLRGHRRRWRIASTVALAVGFVLYLAASLLAKPTPEVDGIKLTADRATGALKISVAAHHLRSGQRLQVRAQWDARKYGNAVGRTAADASASDAFTVGPVSESTTLRVIAYITAVKHAGEQPTGLDCGGYDACSDLVTPVKGAVPDLRTRLVGRTLRIAIARDARAPDRVVLVVLRRGHEIYKDNPAVERRPYARSLPLSPRHGARADQVCVVATYRVERLRGCRPDPAVSLSRFPAPR